MTNYRALLTIAHEAVDIASHLMRTVQPGALTPKGDRDMASEVDYEIERRVREFLAAKTPEIGFLGEEEGAQEGSDDLMWAFDPVDGTVNFIHGSPMCAVSLGLFHRDSVRLGVIDTPFLGYRYSALEGAGAFANGRQIQSSRTVHLSEAVVAIGDYAVGTDAGAKNRSRFAITERLAARVQRVRMHGSAAIDLAWLAHGRIDAAIMLSNKPWDTSAGVIIARESGALVRDADGSEHTLRANATIAATSTLLTSILQVVGDK
jgi:myo-inositol-1(or 4)-monophosphatase